MITCTKVIPSIAVVMQGLGVRSGSADGLGGRKPRFTPPNAVPPTVSQNGQWVMRYAREGRFRAFLAEGKALLPGPCLGRL